VARLVDALRNKAESHDFDSRWFFRFFIGLIIPTAMGSTQPLTEMSTRAITWGAKAAGA
jgi:hypothetical protein